MYILTKKDEYNLLRSATRSKRYTAIVLLMLDAGLRVSEAVSCRIGYIDFYNDFIIIPSLKKRGKNITRTIPITPRLRAALVDLIHSLKDYTKDSFLFPTRSELGHLNRRRVYRYIQRSSGRRFKPHDLRHTYATKICKHNDLAVAKELLGHKSQMTTEIYIHADLQDKIKAVQSITPKTFFDLFKKKVSRYRDPIFDVDLPHSHVGRSEEVKTLRHCLNVKQNLIVLGPQGIGKSHLLSFISGDNLLYLDDFKSVKMTLTNLVKHVGKYEECQKMMILNSNDSDLENVITKSSAARLMELLFISTKRNQFTLVIDDLTDVTKSGVRVLEKLKDHFHIIAAARQVKIINSSMLTNFDKLDLKPLSRVHCFELIEKKSKPIHERIQDYYSFRDHVFRHSKGNPLFVSELILKLAKHKSIDTFTIRDTRHTSTHNEFDTSLLVIFGLSSLMILRYLALEMDSDTSGAFRLAGGAFLLFALFSRQLFGIAKRKFI